MEMHRKIMNCENVAVIRGVFIAVMFGYKIRTG
jgi:hypothetical protein